MGHSRRAPGRRLRTGPGVRHTSTITRDTSDQRTEVFAEAPAGPEPDPPQAQDPSESDPPRSSPPQGEAPRGSYPPDPQPGRFPVALRGYDRDAVDAYVANLRQRIIELEAVRTPESIMRRALEQVGQETSGILQQAQETAREMATRSRQQADERLSRAKRDADEVRVSSELRLRQMDADTDVIWRERAALLDDVRRIASELLEVTERADKRYPPEDDTGSGRTGAIDALPAGRESGGQGGG